MCKSLSNYFDLHVTYFLSFTYKLLEDLAYILDEIK